MAVFFSLLVGVLIYITFRSGHCSPIMQGIVDVAGGRIASLVYLFIGEEPRQWLIYSLPDSLWMFAFCTSILIIWSFEISKFCWFWISVALAMGMLLEILQYPGYIPGTFDSSDLLVMLGAAGLAFLFTIKIPKNVSSI